MHIYAHTSPKYTCKNYLAYMLNLVGIFVYGIYLAISDEVEVIVRVFRMLATWTVGITHKLLTAYTKSFHEHYVT